MAKLTDIQRLLLTTAAARGDGSLLPPPEQCGDLNTRIRKSISSLIDRGLAEERTQAATSCIWLEQDGQHLGVFITDAGRAAIGVKPEPLPLPLLPVDPALTKIDTVVAMLRRDKGATLTQLIETTGWLPHTTRAALTRLRQKGHRIEKGTRDSVTTYSIAAA